MSTASDSTLPDPRPRFRFGLSQDEDVRSLQVGLLLTLLIWPSLMWLLLSMFAGMSRAHEGGPTYPRPKPVFSIEMAPEQFIMPEKPKPLPDRFVEPNPDAPDNAPDQTRNFAAQNQQVAQEKPAKEDKSDMPMTEGKKDMESNQIVTGSLSDPQPATAPPPPPSPELMQAVKEAQQQREQNPLAGNEKIHGESDSGYGFNLGKISDNPENVPEKREGSKTAPLIVGAPQHSIVKVDPQKPLPRPRLEKRVRPAVMVERVEGTTNIGITAMDARWSQYGQYLARLVDSVQIEWERIIDTSGVRPPQGSTVEVKFRLEAEKGEISEVISVKGNAGNTGNRACTSAITARAPYGKWTDDMIAVLGESQELTFTFLYQ